MAHDFVKLFDRAHFSNYEPEFAFRITCPKCGHGQRVGAEWKVVPEGFDGNDAPARNAIVPWVLRRHLQFTCASCQTALTVYLSGAAGGRHGEIQYGLAGLSYDGQTLL
jgi:hypothetical protein